MKQETFEFFLVPGDITIKAKDRLPRSKVEGPDAVTDFVKLKKDEQEYIRKRTSIMDGFLGMVAISKKDEGYQEKMRKKADSLNKRMKDDVYLAYVRANPSSQLSLHALKSGIPTHIDSANKYIGLLSTLSPEIQKWASTKKLLELLVNAKKTEIGKTISDFQQWDSLGNTVKFSSFKGKYVLIELWASWCGPCRMKNPELVKIYDKYSKEKFTILGIALEQKDDKEKWLKAIQKDQLKWPQLTDFKFWNNAVAREWGIQAIPFNLLVDPTGKILAKNLYGPELDDKLSELFRK